MMIRKLIALFVMVACTATGCIKVKEKQFPPPELDRRNTALDEVIKQKEVLKNAGVDQSLKLLRHEDHRVRIEALRRLAKLKAADISALGAMENALGDEDEKVRVETAMALGEIGTDEALSILIGALSDSSYTVTLWAKKSFVRAKDTATRVLVSHLVDLATPPIDESEDDDAIRLAKLAAIRDCLTKIGVPAVPLLTDSIENGSVDLRNHVVGVLGEIGPKASGAIKALLALLDPSNDTSVRLSAIRAIEKIGDVDPSVTPALLRTQADENQNIAKTAKQAIRKLSKDQRDSKD